VRDALSSGRDEMQRHEEQLWSELAAQGVEPHGLAAPPKSSSGRFGRTPAKSASHLAK
jgi:hypothetical protein